MRLRLARKLALIDAFGSRRRTTWLRYIRRWGKFCRKQWRWREARDLNPRHMFDLVNAGQLLKDTYPMPTDSDDMVSALRYGYLMQSLSVPPRPYLMIGIDLGVEDDTDK